MRTIRIGNSGIVCSRLAYGAMRLPGTWNPAEITPERRQQAHAALRAAYEAGYTLFDHADIYCRGACERLHGELLQESPQLRAHTIIATKCGIRFTGDPAPDSPHRYDFSSSHIIWSCEQSLRRLGVDAIDIYQLHRPDPLMNPHEVAEAFEKLRSSGKVRYFGVSNFLPSFLATLQSALSGKLVVNQVEIHLGRLDCLGDGTLDQCLRENITPLSWSPLGGGFLGEGGSVGEKHPRRETMVKLQESMDQVKQRLGISRTQLALAWLLKHPAGIVPIVGSVKPGHIADAARSVDIDLSREDWYRLLIAARGSAMA